MFDSSGIFGLTNVELKNESANHVKQSFRIETRPLNIERGGAEKMLIIDGEDDCRVRWLQLLIFENLFKN